MIFKKISRADVVADYIYSTIAQKLNKKQKVLWLLAGGSAIAVETEAAHPLKKCLNLDQLTISLGDERFGQVGHNDSNWEQLKRAGFDIPGANLKPLLQNENLEVTLDNWQKNLKQELADANYVLAIAGIGADGHIFGIKPGSPALLSKELAVGFEWTDYTRLTITAVAIEDIDEIVVFAKGAEKREQLVKLSSDIPITEQPAQILKQCSRVIIFNDQIDKESK